MLCVEWDVKLYPVIHSLFTELFTYFSYCCSCHCWFL